jgi:hypothetical protein
MKNSLEKKTMVEQPNKGGNSGNSQEPEAEDPRTGATNHY